MACLKNHTVRDDHDFEVDVNYVHINPVKHGYLARAINRPHSTNHRYVKRGMLPRDWACMPDNADFSDVQRIRSASIELLDRTNWIQFALPAVWGANRQRSLASVARGLTGRARIAIGASPVLLEQSQAVGNEIILDNLPLGARDATRGFTGTWCQSIAANK